MEISYFCEYITIDISGYYCYKLLQIVTIITKF